MEITQFPAQASNPSCEGKHTSWLLVMGEEKWCEWSHRLVVPCCNLTAAPFFRGVPCAQVSPCSTVNVRRWGSGALPWEGLADRGMQVNICRKIERKSNGTVAQADGFLVRIIRAQLRNVCRVEPPWEVALTTGCLRCLPQNWL